MNSQRVGEASCLLGAGRETMGDAISPDAGIIMAKGLGDPVKQGELIATLHFDEEERLAEGRERLISAMEIGDAPPKAQPLIFGVVESEEEIAE